MRVRLLRKFAVGAINATYESYVRPLIDNCLKNNNITSVKVVLGHSIDLIQLLQDNVLDLVFSSIPLKRTGYVCEVFDSDRLVLVAGKGANAYPDGITEDQLTHIPYLMCNFALSEVRGVYPFTLSQNYVFRLEVDNFPNYFIISNKDLDSFLPYKMIKSELDAGCFEEVPLKDFPHPR
ncbi:MAG: LysR substrate-binding domain-containing protein [Christensenellaceae bacterium]